MRDEINHLSRPCPCCTPSKWRIHLLILILIQARLTNVFGSTGKSLLDPQELLRFMMTKATEQQQRVEVVEETMTEWE